MPPRAAAIVIGASAGALEALSTILPELPSNYPLPIFVVVHLPRDRHSVMAEVLNRKCRIPVREVEDKEPIVGGTIFVAPPDYHLLVESNDRLSLSCDEPVHYSRPSVDVLFETAADCYGKDLVGIILTGANEDGAAGLKAIVDAGGIGLVQKPELASAPTMPRAALAACRSARAMSLEELTEYLVELVGPL